MTHFRRLGQSTIKNRSKWLRPKGDVVITGHYFKPIRGGASVPDAAASADANGLQDLLVKQVADRFRIISGTDTSAIPIMLPASGDEDDPQPNPCHPVCAEYAASDYCRESWQLHWAELRRSPATHWHKCDRRRLCAIVPLVCQGRCPAVMKLACRPSVGEQEFIRQVELLDLLVRDFGTSHAEFLGRVLGASPVVEISPPTISDCSEDAPSVLPRHPQVLRALAYVEAHLADPRLTVGRVAAELDIHPSYLSQLFAERVGKRLGRVITGRRVEMAKTLLVSTNWQIKRIAHETGHANPNWFCHVFRVHTGLTPLGYRRRSVRPD